MNSDILVSVIVPVYNVEKYLDFCISSIVNQTYPRLEIILVDDGSTDNSGEICDAWQKKDKRIVVIHKDNGGLSSARNTGISNASGDYLSFIDSDDYIHPGFVELLLDMCIKYDCKLSICNYLEVDESDSKMYSVDNSNNDIVESKELFEYLFTDKNVQTVSASNKLYDKRIFEDLRYSSGLLHEDEEIIHKIISKIQFAAWTNEKLYFYRQTPNSISRKYKIKNVDEIKAKLNRLAFFEENSMGNLYQKQLYVICSRIIYHYGKLRNLTDETKKYEIELLQQYVSLYKSFDNRTQTLKNNIRLCLFNIYAKNILLWRRFICI